MANLATHETKIEKTKNKARKKKRRLHQEKQDRWKGLDGSSVITRANITQAIECQKKK